ncbi:MAG: hypothetical protein K0Q74_1134 [Gammaproteobacteria bacterium]|nr:hypothetical protein [Gammaproteobacteria bacterium]
MPSECSHTTCMLRFLLDCRVAITPRKGGRTLTVCANLGREVIITYLTQMMLSITTDRITSANNHNEKFPWKSLFLATAKRTLSSTMPSYNQRFSKTIYGCPFLPPCHSFFSALLKRRIIQPHYQKRYRQLQTRHFIYERYWLFRKIHQDTLFSI